MATLEISYEGKEYLLDIEDMDTDEARVMERFGVKSLLALESGIGEGDISALTVAYWLMLKQSGEPGVRIERMKFKPIKFLKALGAAGEKVQAAKEEEEELGKGEE
jgi:hypothetical protein